MLRGLLGIGPQRCAVCSKARRLSSIHAQAPAHQTPRWPMSTPLPICSVAQACLTPTRSPLRQLQPLATASWSRSCVLPHPLTQPLWSCQASCQGGGFEAVPPLPKPFIGPQGRWGSSLTGPGQCQPPRGLTSRSHPHGPDLLLPVPWLSCLQLPDQLCPLLHAHPVALLVPVTICGQALPRIC